MAGADGVLSERGEPNLNGDSVQFKGILMRFLADLWLVRADENIRDFILTNADSLWANAKRANTYQVGACWRGPFDSADAARQGSAIDALVAAAAVAQG
jgi:predicted alpha-1,6-mannanase (GH76 family)